MLKSIPFLTRLVSLSALLVGAALVTGCPTQPSSTSSPESVEPEVAEAELEPSPEEAEPEVAEPEGTLVEPEAPNPDQPTPEAPTPETPTPETPACAISDTASTSQASVDTFEIAQSGMMKRGPGGLTQIRGPYGNAIQNVVNGTRWVNSAFEPSAMTRDWTKELVRVESGVAFRSTVDETLHWTIAPPAGGTADASVQLGTSALSPDDATAATLWCWSDWSLDPAQEGSILILTDVDTGNEVGSFAFEGCADAWSGLVQIHLNHGGMSGVLVGVPDAGMTPFAIGSAPSPSTILVDMETIPEEDRFFPARPILSAALSPNGQWLGVSTIDGQVKMVEVATGDTKWSAPAGRMSVNQMTFQPSVESPVGFSTDGDVFVFTNEMPALPVNGEVPPEDVFATVSLVTATTGVELEERTIPIELFSPSSSGVVAGAPMTLLYDGQGLTVGVEGGSVHFGCVDPVIPPGPGPFSINVDGPSVVSRADPTVTFTVTATTPGVAIRGIVPGPNVWSSASLADDVAVSIYNEAGDEITLTVLVDNGFETVTEEVTLTVVD